MFLKIFLQFVCLFVCFGCGLAVVVQVWKTDILLMSITAIVIFSNIQFLRDIKILK
jgi:hypothetical protein